MDYRLKCTKCKFVWEGDPSIDNQCPCCGKYSDDYIYLEYGREMWNQAQLNVNFPEPESYPKPEESTVEESTVIEIPAEEVHTDDKATKIIEAQMQVCKDG